MDTSGRTKRTKLGYLVGLIVGLALLAALVWRLPINGWASLLWLVSMLAMSLIRAPYEQQSELTETEDSRQGSVENALLFGVMLGASLLPAIHLLFGVFWFANYSAPVWLPYVGLVLLGFGLWLFWRSHADLGRNWSVSLEIREDHGLVTTGVYKRIRHPMYSAIFILFIAQAAFIQNYIAGFSGLVAFTLMYVIRVPTEEAMMRDAFGTEYEAYCSRSGRLLPWSGSKA